MHSEKVIMRITSKKAATRPLQSLRTQVSTSFQKNLKSNSGGGRHDTNKKKRKKVCSKYSVIQEIIPAVLPNRKELS